MYMPENTENTNKKQKTIKMIAALVLTFTALIVAFTLPNLSNKFPLLSYT